MQLNAPIARPSRGFTLLEVLVALVVLSIGLLGLSGLQTHSLRNNHSAFLRSQATLAGTDIIDRMRANRAAAAAGDYDIGYTAPMPSSPCVANCSALDVANRDLQQWRSYVERLPGGEGEISVTAAGIAEVKIRWVDSRDPAAKLEIVTRSQI
jgi:type IV pilus assembly protein PilV